MTDGSPPTAPDRIAAIRVAMTDDAEAQAAFAEPVRASVEAAIQRLDALAAGAPYGEAATILDRLRDRVSGLNPAQLEPRRGLGGLFDSRGKRLRTFRAAYASAADEAMSGATDLADRGGVLARRADDLETLWVELRGGVESLDDHVAAGRVWLADRAVQPTSPITPEAAAAFEDMPEAADETAHQTTAVLPTQATTADAAPATPLAEAIADPDGHANADDAALTQVAEAGDPLATSRNDAALDPPVNPPADRQSDPSTGDLSNRAAERAAAEVVSVPHPLEARLDALVALRTRAVAALPRIRALQNADHASPSALASAREAVEAWVSDWRAALGLGGRKPKKVRPDAAKLVDSRDALIGRLTTAGRTLSAAQARLTELTPARSAPSTEVREVA